MEVELPEFRGDDPAEILLNLYKDLGWGGKSCFDPRTVLLNKKDWERLLEKVMKSVPEEKRIPAGLFAVSKGPSLGNVPEGKVLIR